MLRLKTQHRSLTPPLTPIVLSPRPRSLHYSLAVASDLADEGNWTWEGGGNISDTFWGPYGEPGDNHYRTCGQGKFELSGRVKEEERDSSGLDPPAVLEQTAASFRDGFLTVTPKNEACGVTVPGAPDLLSSSGMTTASCTRID